MSANVQDIHALAPSQRGMLLEGAQGTAKSGLFIEQSILSVRGHLDRDRFAAALERIVGAHASLRSCFAWDAERPVQVVLDRVRLPLEWLDWRGNADADDPSVLAAWLEQDRARGMAVNRAPLWRFTVIQRTGQTCNIVWTHHHLITDGWSIAVVLADLLQHYAGERPVPPARPLRDYIDWIDAQDRDAAVAFWRRRLAASPRAVPLAPRGTVDRFAELTEIDVRALPGLARTHAVSLATAVFAAWALVLRTFLATDEVIFGVTVHGRPASLDGVERIVGPFISTFPLPVTMRDVVTPEALLAQIESLQHDQRPFEYLSAAEVHQAANVATRLYDSVVVVEHTPRQASAGDAGLSVTMQPGSGARSHHPLLLRVAPNGVARLLYNQRQVDEETAAGLAAALSAAASQLSAHDGLSRLGGPVMPRPASRSSVSRAPGTHEEQVVLALARTLFGGHANIDDNFFDLGGHSLLAVEFVHRLGIETGFRLPVTQLLLDARLASIAQALRDGLAGVTASGGPPSICFIPGNPGSPLYAAGLAAHLDGWRLHGLEAPGLDGTQAPLPTVEALAGYHLASLPESDAPTVLVGHSFGGWVAFEMGLRLQQRGRTVSVILLDTIAPDRLPSRGDVSDAGLWAEVERLRSRASDAGFAVHVTSAAFAVYAAARRVIYAPSARAAFSVALFRAGRAHPDDNWDRSDPAYGWGERCDALHVECVEGDHVSMMTAPAVEILAGRILHWLRR